MSGRRCTPGRTPGAVRWSGPEPPEAGTLRAWTEKYPEFAAEIVDFATDWIEMDGTERSYGMFEREAFGNQERARMMVAVKRLNDVTAVSVLENRQRWHLKGGISQQATKWWPIDPSEEAEAAVVNRLNNKLREKGCVAS